MYSNPRYLEDGKFVPIGVLARLTFLDDILSDIVSDSDDLLGLDHVNKSRNFWNRSESFFIR